MVVWCASLEPGRNKMTELAARLGIQRSVLENSMISMVREDYESDVTVMLTADEMFEMEMILESKDAEKMARISLLLQELKDYSRRDKEKKFKELHGLISTVDGEQGIKLYDRFHYLLGESGKFDRPDELIDGKKPGKKKKRKFRKRRRK